MTITIKDVRAKFPQYSDFTNQELADALHKKFYGDLESEDFYGRIGFDPAKEPPIPARPTGDPIMEAMGAPAMDAAPQIAGDAVIQRPGIPQSLAEAMGAGVAPVIPAAAKVTPAPKPDSILHVGDLPPTSMGGAGEDQEAWARREIARLIQGETGQSPLSPVPAHDPVTAEYWGKADSDPVARDRAVIEAALQSGIHPLHQRPLTDDERGQLTAKLSSMPVVDDQLVEAMGGGQGNGSFPQQQPVQPVADQSTAMGDLRAGVLGLQNAGTAGAILIDQGRANLNRNYGNLPTDFVANLDRDIADYQQRIAASTDPAERQMLEAGLQDRLTERQGYLDIGADPEFQAQAAEKAGVADDLEGRILRERIPTMARRAAEAAAIPSNPAADAIGNAQSFGEGFKALASDPLGAVRSLALRSAPQMAPVIAGGVAGQVVAGPGGAAVGAGATGAGVEAFSYASQKMTEAMAAAGVDVSDPVAVDAFLTTHESEIRKMYTDGMKRGGIIGAMDAVSGGIAGKIATKVAGKSLGSKVAGIGTGAVVEAATEGAGEAAAGYAVEGKVNPGDVLAEVIGGAGMGAPATAAQIGAEVAKSRAGRKPASSAPQPPRAPVDDIAAAMGANLTPDVKPTSQRPAQPVAPAVDPLMAAMGVPEPAPQPAPAPAPAPAQEAAPKQPAPKPAPAPAKPAATVAPAPVKVEDDGQTIVMDETETVDGESVPTGRKVRINLATGQATVVEDTEVPASGPVLEAVSAPGGVEQSIPVQPQDAAALGTSGDPAADSAQNGQNGQLAPSGTTKEIGDGPVEQGNVQKLHIAPAEVAAELPVQADAPAPRPNQPDNIEFIDAAGVQGIGTDPKTMQYRAGGDDAGVTDRLRGVKEWRPERAGMSIIYERKDGTRVIADGHQRLGLAKRLAGEGKRIQMPAMILRETDGITPEEARTTAALKNISEGSGTAVDAAKVLRDTDQSADQLGLPPSSALVRDAMGMRNLSQDAFGMVVNGVATEQHGGIVGRVVSDQAAQANILGLLNRLKPANAFQAEQIARQAASETVTETQDSLFGPETDTANLYLERAKVLDAALKRVKDDVKTFRTLVDRAEAVQSAGNVLDAAANQSRLDTDAAVRDYMAKEANTKGAISNALSAAARSLKAGGKPGSVVNDFLAAVEGELGARGGNGQARDSGRATSEPERGTEPEPDLTAEDSGPDLFGDMAPVAEAVADQPKPEQPDATTEIQRNNARRFRKQAADPDFAGTNAERAALVARAEKIEAKHGDAEPAAETYAGQAFTDPPSAEQLRAILPEDADGNPDYSGALKTAMRAVTKVEKPWSRLTDREKVKVANAIIGADGDAKEQRQAEGSDYALAAEVMSELAQVDALFQNPTTQATDLRQAFAEIDPTIKFVGEVNQPAETAELGADSRYLLRTAAGVDFYVMENDGEVWIDVSRLSSGDGGSAIYAAVSDYALNTDRIFIGDPAGLSSAALVRRTDAMLSSALKHGTTRHLAPHQAQIDGDADAGVPPLAWTAGKDADNIRSLIDVSVSSLMSRVPEIEDARYDFRTGTFRAGDGKPLSVRTLAERSYSESGSGAAGVGSASLKRGILLNTLARTTGDGRAGLLEQALRQPGKLASGLRGTFYQQQIEAADAAEARVAKVMPALRKALDRAGLKGVRLVQNRGVDWQGRFMVAPDGVLEIAIGASLSPTNTLNHEVIHALRQMDLFTEQEWRALELKAVQAWMDEFDIAARYPDLLPPQQIEEAIAEAYAAAIDNKTSPKGGLLVTAFNKIARLLKTLRTVLTGKGYDTPESIFGAVWSGEVGRRPRGGGSVSVAKYSIDASLRQKIKAIWDGARPDAPLVLGKTPAVVAALTKKDLPFVMSAAVVKKAGNHGLTMNDLIAAVEGLGDPVMAFDSTNETGNITVLVDAEAADGRAMVVAVEAAFREAKVEVSRIATVHGKDRPDSIIGWMRDGYLRYINKKKAGEWSRSIGRSLPKDMETKHRRGIKILQHRDVFKASGDGAKFQAADQINSPAFKAWFGDSKVVDADGEPLVVYHGTNDGATTSYDFDENQGKVTQRGPIDFDAFNVGAGGAVSFSDTERADTYAGSVSGSRMIPVYLSLKNPLIFDAEGRKWTNVNGGESTAKGAAKPILDINALAVKARADGHDGLIVKNVVDNSIPMGPDGAVPSSDRPATTYMAFSPTQIKSVFNRGTFDPNDPRISYQRARLPSRQARAHMATKMQGAAHIPDRRIWEELTRDGATVWEKLREGRGAARDQVDRLRIKIQDRFLPMRRAQEALVLQTGVRLTPEQNVYLTETTFSGKAGRHLFEIDEKYTKPIIDMIAETNGALTSDDVGQWLYARHAVERNARIASINPKMPDGGSGMTDAEAAKIMADAAAAPHAADLTKIGTLIDDLRERTLKLREDAGLITATEAAIWRAQYKHYVPLKGFAETDHSEAVLDITGAGRRFNVRGDESKRALGRKSEAFNPLQAAITQAQEASIRAEKNRVGQAMLKLAEDYPQPALWEVKKPVQKQYFNKTTGLVETRTEAPVSLMQEPNEMAVKRDGQEFRVMFKDPRLARALGNVGADQMGAMLRVLSPLSRWYSATRTTLNPEFVITNAMRDFETAQINATALPVNGKARIAKAMAKNWRKAFVGVLRGQGGAEDTVWTKRYAEFQKAGGQVSFWVLEQPEAGKSDMDKRIARARGGAAARTLKAMIAPSFRDNLFLSSIERVNLAVDNAIRLAAFAEARDMGLNEQDAASLAKNLTVNFNRRGEWGSALNIVYPFFNAAVQGSARLIQAMKNPKMLVGLTVGGVGLGVVMDLVNASLSEEDDDGELLYDKVPDYRSRRFLHVVYGSGDGDTPWSIPLAYGYNIFPYAGQQLGKVIRGVKKPEDAFADTAEAFAQAWLPTDSLIPGLIVEPAWELATNENYFGSAIMPEDSWGNSKYIPPSERYFPSATEASKTVASTLNKWTGGNSVDAGAVSVSPEVIDYWTAYAFGSFGRFAGQTTDNLTKALQGKAGEIEARDMPFAKNLWSEVSDYDTKDRYKRFGFAVRDAAYDIANIGEDEELPAETKKLSALLDALKKAEREIDGTSEFNQDGRKYGGVPPRDPEAVMTEFNKLFIKAAGKQAE